MELQRVLRRDPRARLLPAGWRDLVLHLTFQQRVIRRQVRHFVRAALAQEWSTTVLRAWQAWLRLQTFYDPPTWNSWVVPPDYRPPIPTAFRQHSVDSGWSDWKTVWKHPNKSFQGF